MEIKFEVGKKYKLRRGTTARCICVDRKEQRSVVLLETAGEVEVIFAVDAEGKVWTGKNGTYDVIAEHKEPRVLYSFFNRDGRYQISTSEKDDLSWYKEHRPSWTCVIMVEKLD
jgi:hypothetical protein